MTEEHIDLNHDDVMDAAYEMYEALNAVREACLYPEDDGMIGVTLDPSLSEGLFADICAALAKARGQ